VIYGPRKSSPLPWWRQLRLQSAGLLVAILAILATVLAPTAIAQVSAANWTRQIKRCDKKFAGHTKRQRKARRRCIKKAKNGARRTEPKAQGQGPVESSPGSPPLQSQGSSSLALATATLHEGVAGLPYVDQLSATGGTAPYSYAVSNLPSGLSGDSSGLISGSPTALGTSNVSVEVTDADGAHVQGVVTLAVPTTMPADCMQQSCSHLIADGDTVQIDGSKVTGVTQDPQTKEVTGLSLTGPAPAPQQIIVVSPTEALPTGLTALVLTATSSGSEETSLTLNQATIGDAYASGTVQAIGSTPPAEGSHLATTTQRHSAASTGIHSAAAGPALAGASLSCGSGVSSDLRGLNVKPSLTPSMAAIWHHPLFGGGGFYPGTGGLELFQFDLNGDIQLNMGVSISGKATCTLQLPSLVEAIPAGDLGAVIIETTPTLTLIVDGKVDTRASITLSCGVEYRWDEGTEYRGSYCAHHYEPLHLAADTGVNVTASGELETAVSLDDVVGVDGSITAALHAGYTPTLQPVAELDASLEYELGACLVCFWKGSPTRVTIAHGILYHKTIATYDSAPPSPTDNSIQVEGLDFGALPAGQETIEHLTASGGTSPYTFAVSPDPGNEAKVPSWVHLAPDGTLTIDPPAETNQSVSFYVYATDADGQDSPFEREQVTFSIGTAPQVAYEGAGDISEVSCPSVGHCVALLVNSGGTFGISQASGWSATKLPEIADPLRDPSGQESQYRGLKCYENGEFCVAFSAYYEVVHGDYSLVPVIALEEDGVWSTQRAPEPPDEGTSNEPPTFERWREVSCSGRGFCIAISEYATLGSAAVVLTGHEWSAEWFLRAPNPESTLGPEVDDIDCPSSGFCTAVGSLNEYQFGGREGEYGGAIWSYAQGTWSVEPAPATEAAAEREYSVPIRVSCSSPDNCAAMGVSEGAFDFYWGEVMTESGGAWSVEEIPLPEGAVYGAGEAMSCYAPEECTFAIGVDFDGYGSPHLHLYMLQQTGQGLSGLINVALPSNAASQNVQLADLICKSADSCRGLVRYLTSETEETVGLLTVEDGAPSIVEAPTIDGEELRINSDIWSDPMSCPESHDCAVIGKLGSRSVIVMLEE
jgi:hypothetical protein